MNLQQERRVLVVIAGLAGVNIMLAAAVLYLGFRGRPTLIVPGVATEQVSLPSQVPDDALRNFALLYLVYFDDYSPATAAERAKYLLQLVSPDRIEVARRAIEERTAYIVRAREASQISLPLPESIRVERLANGRYRIELAATKRTLIADVPKESLDVRYELEVAPFVPTETNRYGLVVTSQVIEAQSAQTRDVVEEKHD